MFNQNKLLKIYQITKKSLNYQKSNLVKFKVKLIKKLKKKFKEKIRLSKKCKSNQMKPKIR